MRLTSKMSLMLHNVMGPLLFESEVLSIINVYNIFRNVLQFSELKVPIAGSTPYDNKSIFLHKHI